MKVVITRDESGCVEFWPIRTLKYLKKDDDCGEWESFGEQKIVAVSESCFEGLCTLLGFTPRKGSKQVVDIAVKRLKK